MKENGFVKFSDSVIRIAFEILAAIILFSRVVYLVTSVSENKLVEIVLFIGVLILFAIIVLFWKRIDGITHFIIKAIRSLSVKKMILTIVLVGIITKIAMLFLFQIDSSGHIDCSMYWSFIQQLTNNNVITENAEYAVSYPHTVMFSLLFIPFTKIFGANSILLVNAYLCVLFTVCSVLLFDTIKCYFGKNYAFAAVMAWILIPFGMLEPLLLVHENAFVVLHIIGIWLLFKLFPCANNKILRILYLVASGIVFSVSALINNFAIVSIIAIVIVSAVNYFKKFSFKSFMKWACVSMVFVVLFLGFNSLKGNIIEKVVDYNPSVNSEDYTIPYSWPVYVGMNYESYGEWDLNDNKEFFKYQEINNKEEAQNYQINLIKTRFNDYLSNPIKAFKHFIHKFEIITLDFNPLKYNLGNSVNELFFSGYNGLLRRAMNVLFTLINIFVALVLCLSYKRRRECDKPVISYLKLFLLGTCAILTLVEVHEKYSSHLLFVYLSVAAVNYSNFSENMYSINNKLRFLK